jgi:hypothetical protein
MPPLFLREFYKINATPQAQFSNCNGNLVYKLSLSLSFSTVPISGVAVTSLAATKIKKYPQSNMSPHTVIMNPHPLNTWVEHKCEKAAGNRQMRNQTRRTNFLS